jgi:hypothetical protein
MALSKSGIWHLQKSILSSYLALSSGGQRRPVLDIRLAQACLFGQSALSRVVSAAGQFILDGHSPGLQVPELIDNCYFILTIRLAPNMPCEYGTGKIVIRTGRAVMWNCDGMGKNDLKEIPGY